MAGLGVNQSPEDPLLDCVKPTARTKWWSRGAYDHSATRTQSDLVSSRRGDVVAPA